MFGEAQGELEEKLGGRYDHISLYTYMKFSKIKEIEGGAWAYGIQE